MSGTAFFKSCLRSPVTNAHLPPVAQAVDLRSLIAAARAASFLDIEFLTKTLPIGERSLRQLFQASEVRKQGIKRFSGGPRCADTKRCFRGSIESLHIAVCSNQNDTGRQAVEDFGGTNLGLG